MKQETDNELWFSGLCATNPVWLACFQAPG